jgi:hypothetical protein
VDREQRQDGDRRAHVHVQRGHPAERPPGAGDADGVQHAGDDGEGDEAAEPDGGGGIPALHRLAPSPPHHHGLPRNEQQ